MSRVIQAGEFFVVGGPVQPDRLCYVERTADRVLETSIQAQRFSYVLAPRASGKSSLMGRAARTLRRAGGLAAIVDLAQLEARGASADAASWSRAIAHRIARELRLSLDVEQWWRDKSALGEQRLDDFFWEVVLTHTTAPVTVFLDEIERATALSFAPELFATIRACYTHRAAEPDYARLNFVVLGVATPESLCPDPRLSPFVDGQAIELADFSAAQSYRLAPGLGGDPALAQALLDRVHVWTNGHPYLTQKVARAVARKTGKLEDVERAVREQLLRPAALHDDALLTHIDSSLGARAPVARAARGWLRRIAKGATVKAGERGDALTLLRLLGLVVEADGALRYRNRVFAEAFGRRWLKAHRPKRWRIAAAVAAAAIAAVAGAYWYQEYLPRPYLRALENEATGVAALESAHARLRDLPGFAQTADALMRTALETRGTRADDFAEVSAVDRALRSALGDAELADRLTQEFWVREAQSAMHDERRDDALLLARQAVSAGSARSVLAEVIGPDYARLTSVLDWPAAPPAFVADWQARRLVGLDDAQRVQGLGLETGAARTSSTADFTVLEHRPRELALEVDERGSAGAFTLSLVLDHPAAQELALTLTAPSGAQSDVLALRAAAETEHAYVAAARSELGVLSDEDREGTWRLSIVDTVAGNDGALVSWALAFGADAVPWRAVPTDGAAIPDAVRVAASVTIVPNGRLALARPAGTDAGGSLAVWRLEDGALLRDVVLPQGPAAVALSADGSRLAAAAGNVLRAWSVADADSSARVVTQTRFTLPPAVSPDGEYLMIAEEVEGAAPLFSLLRAADGAFLASSEGEEGLGGWLLGPQARYLVLLESSGAAPRVTDPRRGGTPRALPHPQPVERIVMLPSETAIVTVDSAGDVRLWRIGGANGGTATFLGTTIDAATLSVADDGSRVAFAARGSVVHVADGRSGARLVTLRLPSADAPARTAVSPGGETLVTATGPAVRMWDLAGAAGAGGALETAVTAIALDGQEARAALGFRGGYVRTVPSAALAGQAAAGLDFFGHRGAVASIAASFARDVIASGGASDGAVRLWSATGEPRDALAHGISGAVQAVAVSHDGAVVASAAGSSVRLWRLADAPRAIEAAAAAARVTALAFSADDRLLAIGGAGGGLRFVAAVDGTPVGTGLALAAAPRWLSPGADPATWYVATDHWLHELQIMESAATIVRTRLLPADFEPLVAGPGASVRGVRGLGTSSADVAALATALDMEPLAESAPELAEDWPAVLGRRVAADGSIEPYTR